jgi:NAD/NADP transhydrogenase beta subunit
VTIAPGYAGIESALFYNSNAVMVLGVAKKLAEEITKALVHWVW